MLMHKSMVGPEFISMTAGEAENPRRLMSKAYTSFVWRLMFFFIGGALCMGIVVPYNGKILHEALKSDIGTAAAYVSHI
jgi:amino acid transporter